MCARLLSATGVIIAGLGFGSPAAAIVISGGSQDPYLDLALDYTSVGQVFLSASDGNYAGSGVVIAPNWVLTAGHVVADALSMSFHLDSGTTRSSFNADYWTAFPKYDGGLGDGYDIGLMHIVDLDDLSSLSVTAATRYTGEDEVGRVGTMVGYGLTGTGETGATGGLDNEKRAGTNVIDAIALTPGRTNRISLVDFDSGSAGDNSYGSALPTTLEALIAPGDSGGGLFIDCLDGEQVVIQCLAGITSFGWGRLDGNPNSDFGDVGGFTRVSYFNAWIDDIIATYGTGGGGGGGGNGNGKGGGPKNRGNSAIAAFSTDVPEPGTLALLVAGLALFALRRRRATS